MINPWLGSGYFSDDGEVETYKFRLIGSGFWQVVEVHYTKVLTRHSGSVNPDMFSTAAATDGELRHYDEEQTFLEVSVDEKIHIEVPEEYQMFLGATGLLKKIYWLVQAENAGSTISATTERRSDSSNQKRIHAYSAKSIMER